jgi:hypothetical protein
LAWQAGNAWGLILIGTLLQSIILVNYPDYAAPSWHGTLIVIACSALAVAANVYGAKWLPYWQNALFGLHILAYVGFIIPIWLNAPRASSSQVWSSWEYRGGWSSPAVAIFIGQMPALASQTAIDSVRPCFFQLPTGVMLIPFQRLSIWLKKFATLRSRFPVS